MAAIAVTAGLVTAIAMLLLVPTKWRASAILAIVPPQFSSDLKPPTLTVQGYETLLRSDAVIFETKQRLVNKHILSRDSNLILGKELDTRIFVSRRAEETSLAPMIELIARGPSASSAKEIANTWATVFLERSSELMTGTTSPTISFIDSQYPQYREKLLSMEESRRDAAIDFQKRIDATTTRNDDTIAHIKMENELSLATFKSETARKLGDLSANKSLELRSAQLDSLRAAYQKLQNDEAKVRSTLAERKLELAATRKQIAEIPAMITLKKAITDNALWNSDQSAGKGKPDWKSLQDRVLLTQQPNPVYQEMLVRLSNLEVQVSALEPRAAQLSDELTSMSGRILDLDVSLQHDQSELVQLEQDRDAGLTNLKEEQSIQVAAAMRERDREVAALQMERDMRLLHLDRDIEQAKALYTELAKNYNQALLAKAQQNVEDVRLAAPAVNPARPEGRGILVKALVMSVLGGILGLLIAAMREEEPKASPH